MIETVLDYEKAREELASLESWLADLCRLHPGPVKGLTKAGVRKMIARLHEELAVYEGNREFETDPAK
jgi:hypothetical protein